jgi:hypothetical protein
MRFFIGMLSQNLPGSAYASRQIVPLKEHGVLKQRAEDLHASQALRAIAKKRGDARDSLTATRRQGLPAIPEHATAHNAEVRGNTAEMHGISPSWITRVPRDWQVWSLQTSRDSERQRGTERYMDYDGGTSDCKHKERACMQTAECAASRLLNDSCVPATLSTKLRNCAEKANARGELGRSRHEPLPSERCGNTSRRPKERMHARAQVRGNDQKSDWE